MERERASLFGRLFESHRKECCVRFQKVSEEHKGKLINMCPSLCHVTFTIWLNKKAKFKLCLVPSADISTFTWQVTTLVLWPVKSPWAMKSVSSWWWWWRRIWYPSRKPWHGYDVIPKLPSSHRCCVLFFQLNAADESTPTLSRLTFWSQNKNSNCKIWEQIWTWSMQDIWQS